MKNFFLVKNYSDCLLYSEAYALSHTPFVLNIHDFRYFDRLGIPFVSLGTFINSQQTRMFFYEYLGFIRRFMDEMDGLNREVAKKYYCMEINLFSLIAYNILTSFYNVFRFVYCVSMIREAEACEFVIPVHTKDEMKLSEVKWFWITESFSLGDEIFGCALDFLSNQTDLALRKIYCPQRQTPDQRKRKGLIDLFIRGIRKFQINAKALLSSEIKFDKFILSLQKNNLWDRVWDLPGIADVETKLGVLYSKEVLSYVGVRSEIDKPGVSVHLNVPDSAKQSDAFLTFFRARDMILALTVPALEKKISESLPYVRALTQLFAEGRVAGVIDHACSVNFWHALTSQVAQRKGISVIGMQHGGHYGYMDFFDKAGYSDFYYCNYWLSWGIDKAYLANTFPANGRSMPEIIPVGSTAISSIKKSVKRTGRKRVKAIYPMVNNLSLTQGTFRTEDMRLYFLQKKILWKLCLSHEEIMIKPHAGFRIALEDMLKKVPSNIFVTCKPLPEIYREFEFDWIILDYLSTPFEEACVSDSQILVFNDMVLWPIESHARELMEKRAWVFDNEEMFLKMLDKVLSAEVLEEKSDTAFENSFILPFPDAILKTKEELLKIVAQNNAKPDHAD